ncbi:MAG: type II toxin-antitoxin system RelE/ParE family toxin [Zwartia sp.]
MINKRFIPHRFAVEDEEEIVHYYEQTSSEQVALGFINALDQAFSQLSRYPHMGSPRPEYDLELDGIRSWPLKKFPHLIYYEIQTDHIELWRILHPKRDIVQTMLPSQRSQ